MINRLREQFSRFMIGRYGTDGLGRFILLVAFAWMLAGLFIRESWVNTVALLFLILCYYRMLSKNSGKRYEENQKFEKVKSQFLKKIRDLRFKFQQKKEYHIYKCPQCGQKIRVPRGKGKISIHCPKCNTDFIEKS